MILANGTVRVALRRYSHIPDVDITLSVSNESGSAYVVTTAAEARVIAGALIAKAQEWEALQ